MFYARCQRFRRQGVIQIHRHFAQQQRGEIRQRARHARRQQQSNHLLSRPDLFQPPREKNRSHQRRAKSDAFVLRVRHGKPARMFPARAHKRARQSPHSFAAIRPCANEKLLHRLAHFKRRRGRRQRFAKIDGDRMRNPRRQAPHESSALETRWTAEHTIQRHWNDGRLHIFHDAFHAAPERQQLPDARDLSLRKNAHHFARANGVTRRLQRLEHLTRTLLRAKWE